MGNFDRHLDLINAIFVIASTLIFRQTRLNYAKHFARFHYYCFSHSFFLFEKLYEKHEIWLSAILNPHFDLIIMDQRRLLENRRLVVHHMHFELLTYLTPFFSRAQHIFVSDTAHFNHD